MIVGAAGGQMSRRDGLRASRVRATVIGCFVVPPRRRLGIARRLATRVADALIERGADELKLNVVSSNAASRAFWASLGYRPVEELLDRRTRGDS